MRSLVHTLMLWILIVSLPAQGMAAVINITCTMAHASATPPFSFAGPHGGRVAERCTHSAPSFTGRIPSRIERPPRG
jgi:hypothetical protein